MGSLSLQAVRKTLQNNPPQSLDELKKILQQVEDAEEREILEAMYFLGQELGPERPHIIALVHGIRTEGIWQEFFVAELAKISDARVVPLGYGLFDTLRFLCPIGTRSKPISKMLLELRTLKSQNPDAHISIVAHSFGTYIVSKILDDATDLEFHRLQLCGAVVDQNFRWDKVISRVKGAVVNDVGSRDRYPALAKSCSWGFGAAGTFGFKNAIVQDRYFDYGHSDFFTAKHMRRYWFPYLLDGQIVASAFGKQRQQSKLAAFISIVHIKYVVLALVAAALLLMTS